MIEDYSKTIYKWLSQFATTYEDEVPDNITPPNEYIVYNTMVSSFDESFIQSISIYSKNTNYTNVKQIADNIEKEITEHGIALRRDYGNVIIYKGSPFYQNKDETDENYKAGYINLEIKIIQKNVN